MPVVNEEHLLGNAGSGHAPSALPPTRLRRLAPRAKKAGKGMSTVAETSPAAEGRSDTAEPDPPQIMDAAEGPGEGAPYCCPLGTDARTALESMPPLSLFSVLHLFDFVWPQVIS